MAEIVYDQTGTFRADLFFEFGVGGIDDGVTPFPREDAATINVPRTPTAEETNPMSDDPKDSWIYIADAGDICGGARVSDFIPNMMDLVICSDTFRQRIEKSPFQGFRIRPFVELEENQSALKDPKLFYLYFAGYNCKRQAMAVGGPNECYHCGYKPLFCKEAFSLTFDCPRCHTEVLTPAIYHKGKDDPTHRLASPKEMNPNPILDGHRWDGSDFIGGGYSNFISKRVLDWLLATHAAPFYAHPIRFCTDGMTDEQLKKLDTMTKMPA